MCCMRDREPRGFAIDGSVQRARVAEAGNVLCARLAQVVRARH